MIFGDPERTEYDLNFALFRIPIRIHPFFWVMAIFLGLGKHEPIPVAIWVVAVLVGILIHELGHALVMRAYGFYPLITLYGMGGQAAFGPGRPYGAREPGQWGHVAISFAGPAAGFLLAAAMYVLLQAAGYDVLVYVWRFILVFVHLAPGELVGSRHLTEFIDDMFFVCVFWGIFNLLPIFPLDGGQIAQRILVMVHPREGVRLSLVISMVAAISVAAFAALNRQFFMAGFFALMAANSYAVLGHQRGGGDPW